jgi:hypothetical protein
MGRQQIKRMREAAEQLNRATDWEPVTPASVETYRAAAEKYNAAHAQMTPEDWQQLKQDCPF